MRKFLFLFLFISLTTTYLNAQILNNNEQSEIQQTLTKFFSGFSLLDTTIIKQYSTKDFLLLENGAVWNVDTIAIHFNQLKGAGLTRINHLDFIQTEVKGNTAWVAYNNTADLTFNDVQKRKLRWLESAFLVKEGKDWKIRVLHSTVVKSKTQ